MSEEVKIRWGATRRTIQCVVLARVAFTAGFASPPAPQAGATGPLLLTYDDLVRLYEEENPAENLQRKLTRLLNTPFVSNAATGAE